MEYFNTIQGQFFYSFPLEVKEIEKIDGIIALLEESGVGELLRESSLSTKKGRPEYDPCKLLTVILLAFAYGNASVREIESYCKYDLRFIYVIGDKAPSYSTISRFIQHVLQPMELDIFTSITKKIYEKTKLSNDTCYLDGTKLLAKPNKYKFVWKPTTFHNRLAEKTRNLLDTLGLGNNVPNESLLPSKLIADKVKEAEQIDPESIGVTPKVLEKMQQNLLEYMLKTMEYEEKERICGDNRKSYFKTDHDATAMCLKEDYYSGLGSNMHPAYSIQLIVASGLIASYWVSQERSDMYSFTSTVDIFHSMYGKYPKRICADSGYGCTTNYKYCEQNSIKAFIKYQDWQGERSGRRPATYEYNSEDNTILCLGGRTGYQTEIKNRHPTRKGTEFFVVKGCEGCTFMPYCRRCNKDKKANEKVFEVSPEFQRYKKEARDRLLTPEGIEMRVNRSCQVEGAFGIIKNDMSYTRFRRIGLNQVSNEFMLTCLGFNIRKYMRFLTGKSNSEYWVAPSDLQPETFKKPSAKRLANHENKKRIIQPNAKAKVNYKYKKK